jgi:ankyrin repeat protein
MKKFIAIILAFLFLSVSVFAQSRLTLLIFVIPSFSQEIHEAVREGDIEKVKKIIKENSKLVNEKDNQINTPLHIAAVKGYIDISKLLIEKGADLEAKNMYGNTPLLDASRIGSANMIKFLIESGADINALDNYGTSIIARVTRRGLKEIVNLLIEKDVEIPVAEENRKELLINSLANGLVKLFLTLNVKGVNLNIKNDNGGSLLHSAVSGGNEEIIKLLIEKGFEVNEPDRYGWVPLHYACERNRIKATKLLIKSDAVINKRTYSGKTAFNIAEEKGFTDILDLLEDKGADTAPRKFPVLKGEYLGQKSPGLKPEIFALDIVSTNQGEHSSITFSPDGKEALWMSGGKILFMKMENELWSAPQIAFFSTGSKYNYDVPFLAPDGKKLFFISNRPLEVDGKGDKENIWFVEKKETWSDPVPISPTVNSISIHWQISVSNKGTLFFGGNNNTSIGMNDIYMSTLMNEEYSKPVNLGKNINTESYDGTPFIAPDESYLLFFSIGYPDGFGDGDLYISYKDKHGNWLKPVNLGENINSDKDELCPIISPEGKYLFFLSTRNGNSNIYWIKTDFIEKLKPKELR